MILPRLAVRNLLGAGLRTWLNVIVLSFSFVAIIFLQGLYDGMNKDATRQMIEMEYGGGMYWQEKYDPYDPFTIQDAHGLLPAQASEWIQAGRATPILVVQGTLYPRGRTVPILLKGIDPGQKIVGIPAAALSREVPGAVPAVIGTRMAEQTGLRAGDSVTVRWRDANGAFDAADLEIVEVMKTTVSSVDAGLAWVPLGALQKMAGMEGHATVLVLAKGFGVGDELPGWIPKGLDVLLSDILALVRSKSAGASVFYVVLLFLALLAIFNTQVLSIFHRRKEMGTLMALGMTRGKIIQLFTLEGALHSVLAAAAAALYGIPILLYFSKKGWIMPKAVGDFGFAISERLFPAYSTSLVVGTIAFVWALTTFVSFLPTRKIAKLKPTEALRGSLP
jgi:ABC-type lipoprotein release transport system permease subunit